VSPRGTACEADAVPCAADAVPGEPAGAAAPAIDLRDAFDLLPLRQMVAASEGHGAVFPRQDLLDRMSRPGRYRIISHGRGVQILAAGELALAEARAMLHQAYGPGITFRTPTVHAYGSEGSLRVPVIFLRIDAPRAASQALLHALSLRSAIMKDVDLQRDRVVLRAELELARALGLVAWIAELTDGAAHVLSWLVRYEQARQSASTDHRAGAERAAQRGD